MKKKYPEQRQNRSIFTAKNEGKHKIANVKKVCKSSEYIHLTVKNVSIVSVFCHRYRNLTRLILAVL